MPFVTEAIFGSSGSALPAHKSICCTLAASSMAEVAATIVNSSPEVDVTQKVAESAKGAAVAYEPLTQPGTPTLQQHQLPPVSPSRSGSTSQHSAQKPSGSSIFSQPLFEQGGTGDEKGQVLPPAKALHDFDSQKNDLINKFSKIPPGGNVEEFSHILTRLALSHVTRDLHASMPQQEKTDEEKSDDIAGQMYTELQRNGYKFSPSGAAGNPMAGHWQRALKQDPELKKKYGDIKGRAAMAEFRAKWAKGQADEHWETKLFTETAEQTMMKKAMFRSIARIAVEEGGGAAGNKASMEYALSCIELGTEWYEYETMSKQVKYLYLEKGSKEVFKKAWKKQSEWRTRVNAESVIPEEEPPVEEPAADQDAGAKKKVAKKAGKGRGRNVADERQTEGGGQTGAVKRGAGGTPTGEPDPKRKKGGGKGGGEEKPGTSCLRKLLIELKATKKDFSETITQATTLMELIRLKDNWQWENSDLDFKPLEQAKVALQEAAREDESFANLMIEDKPEGDLRKKYATQAAFEMKVQGLVESLRTPLKTLKTKIAKLMRQQDAREK